MPRKTEANGYYKVEAITGHRYNEDEKKIELQIKWEGYTEQTWEAFEGFARDTAPMVERYLLRHIVKPLNKGMQERNIT